MDVICPRALPQPPGPPAHLRRHLPPPAGPHTARPAVRARSPRSRYREAEEARSAAGPGCERPGPRGLQGQPELAEKRGADAESGPGTRRPRGGRVAPLPPRALGGAAPAGAVQGAGRDGDVVPRRSRKSLSGHGVADPARFSSFSLPLEPAAARSRRGEPEPSLRTAPHLQGSQRGTRSPPAPRWMDRSPALALFLEECPLVLIILLLPRFL